jgi:serine/threonine protein kinase
MDTETMAACPNCFGDLSAAPCPHCGWQPGGDNPPPALALGTLLDGRYRIGRVLGHGGFGITYLARDENLQLRLAIKEYLPRDCATRAPDGVSLAIYAGQAGEQFAYGLDRFLDEARALARFDQHPGIVTVKSFFRAHGTGYCVMDYVEGLTLKQYLERQPGGRIPVAQAWRLLQPVMDALRAVHKEGLLHRDLAPDNIYITRDGRVKLLDFGAARFAAGEHSRSLSIILKPGYAPEEQYRSRGKQGPWTDVYGLAATLYRAIAGTVPPEALDRLDQDDLVAPSRLGIAITAGQEAVLLKALAVKADARYPTMQGMQEAWSEVERAQEKPAASAPPPASTEAPLVSATPASEPEGPSPKRSGRSGVGGLLEFIAISVLAFAGLSQIDVTDDSPSSSSSSRPPLPETLPATSPSLPKGGLFLSPQDAQPPPPLSGSAAPSRAPLPPVASSATPPAKGPVAPQSPALAGAKAPLYYAAALAPTANIPPEAPLCYKFMVAGPAEQLRKLKAKYSGLYDDQIVTNPEGGQNLMAKRRDENGKEITYFYSTSPGVCNAYQQAMLTTHTPVSSRQAIEPQVMAIPAASSGLNGVYTGNGSNADLRILVENGSAALTLTGDGCVGFFEGSVKLVSGDNWRVIAPIADSPCVIDFQRAGPLSFTVEQGPGCTYYHGFRCEFTGHVTKSQ